MPAVYPVFLRFDGRLAVVVGGGGVAERKVQSLLSVGARVRVVSPRSTDGLKRLGTEGAVELRATPFSPADLADAWLVFACTSDSVVQRAVATACEARRLFCIAVDDAANATAFNGSVVRRPPFVISLSSSGEAPALTRLLRTIVEHVLPPDSFVDRARDLRARWKREGVPHEDRFQELVREAMK